MKKGFYKLLLAAMLGLGIFMVATPADAYHCWWNGNHRVCGGYYHHYYRNCRWVGGFWRYGYWHPAHRVCWY